MNSKTLAKHYDKLTPHERVPLLLAAQARMDDAEVERLMRSAPIKTYSLSDHRWLCEALFDLSWLHMLVIMDLAANFWQAWGLWLLRKQAQTDGAGSLEGNADNRRDSASADEAWAFRLYCMVRHYAFRFVVHVDAWEEFCSGLNIDPETLLNRLPGHDTVARTEKRARELAFTHDEAVTMLVNESIESDGAIPDEPPPVETVEALVGEWQAILEKAMTRTQ